MIRLTVLYNLQPYVDEAEFLNWRLGDHQKNNMANENVVRSDFAICSESYPPTESPVYRFMTTADWPTMEGFKKDFYDEDYQVKLKENLKMLKDPLFLISEILVDESKEKSE